MIFVNVEHNRNGSLVFKADSGHKTTYYGYSIRECQRQFKKSLGLRYKRNVAFLEV